MDRKSEEIEGSAEGYESASVKYIKLHPKIYLSDEATLNSRSERSKSENVRYTLMYFCRPVALRDIQPGDTIIEFAQDLPTICGLRLQFAFASARVRTKGVNICGKTAINANLWPFNICYPGRSFYLFLLQYVASLSFLYVQSALFFYFLLFPWGKYDTSAFNFFQNLFAIWFCVSFGLLACDALFGLIVIPIEALMNFASLFTNGGSPFHIWEGSKRCLNHWSVLFHWFSLTVKLPSHLKFWLVNFICYFFSVFFFVPVAFVLAYSSCWAWFAIHSSWFIYKLSADFIAHFYAGSESADLPLVPFVPCLKRTCACLKMNEVDCFTRNI